jgi:flagellar biosynthesis protein FlhA
LGDGPRFLEGKLAKTERFKLPMPGGDTLLATALFGVLGIVLLPMPTPLMDVLIAFSICLSLLMLLVALYVERPVDFSVFPTLLLAATVFRLSLNVASTRLILLGGGEKGSLAAGEIIAAFGQIVVGGNTIVGVVVFAIFVIINFVVITKGAGRVAEVSARFTLDAMPGKQMAVDAELNAGLIDEKQARTRRAEITREADFYGAMDGASKFIRGDAIASIVITLVNIVGGIVIGVVQNNLSIGEAAHTYTLLTIGDGLVGQIPALVISMGSGILVTRVNDDDRAPLDKQLQRQVLSNPRLLRMLAGAMFALALVPGMRVPFLLLSMVCVILSRQIEKNPKVTGKTDSESGDAGAATAHQSRPEDLLKLEPLTMEVGIDLVYLVDERKGGELVERVKRIRNQFITDLGVVLPSVHLRDNMRLQNSEYVILLRGEEIGRGKIHARQHLAIDPGNATGKLRGIATKDPVFGLDAWWIPDGLVLRAQSRGYTVVDVPTVLTTHFTELMHQHAFELFDMRQLCMVLDKQREEQTKLVDDLVPEVISRAALLKIYRNLIREGLSVRDSQTILESLSEYAPRTRDPNVLTEFVRQALARHVTRRFADDGGTLHYMALGPRAEEAVARALQTSDSGSVTLALDPNTTRRLLQAIRKQVEAWTGSGEIVVLCPPLARGPFQRLLEKALPRTPVLSPVELLPGIKLDQVAVIEIPAPA